MPEITDLKSKTRRQTHNQLNNYLNHIHDNTFLGDQARGVDIYIGFAHSHPDTFIIVKHTIHYFCFLPKTIKNSIALTLLPRQRHFS